MEGVVKKGSSILPLLLLFLAALTAASCAVNPVTGKHEISL